MSTPQRIRLVILMICACALGGCAKSKAAAQIELIECAGFQSAIREWEPIYQELRNRGVQPVAIQPIPILANAYTGKLDRTEVNARWNRGRLPGKHWLKSAMRRGLRNTSKAASAR